MKSSIRSLIAAACLSVAAVSGFAAESTLPVALFASRPLITMPRLSPDGKHLLVTKRVSVDGRDTQIMYVYRTTDFGQVAAVRLPVFHVPNNYWWVSNTRIVVSPGREYGSLEAPLSSGELLAMDLDGGNQEYLWGYQGAKRATSGADRASASFAGVAEERDGRFFINEHQWRAAAESTNLYSIHARSGVRKLVAEVPLRNAYFLVQRDGTAQFAYALDDNDLQLLQFDSAKQSWAARGVIKGERLEPIAFAEKDSAIYAQVRQGHSSYALVRQSLDGSGRRVLAKHPDGNTDLIEWSARNLRPVSVASNVGIPSPIYIEPDSPEAILHKDLSSQFPGSYVSFESFSDDGQQLLFMVSSDRNPGDFYLLDRQTNKARFLFEAMPGIEPKQMGERRPISFTARDDLEIHGYLTLPRGSSGKNLPMVLMPHSGPHGDGNSDKWFFDRDAQFLASRGYAVLEVNFRGSGGRGDSFQAEGYLHWGDRMQDDLIDGVKWTVAQGFADPKRICSYGASYGAYASMMSSMRAPEVFKCAVGYAGLYDLQSLFETHGAKTSSSVRNAWIRAVGNDPAQLKAWSPVHQAEKLMVPVLLVHGEEDTIRPLDQAKAMREALVKAGKPHEWMLVPSEGHGFFAEKNRIAFYERLEAFLAKHIGK